MEVIVNYRLSKLFLPILFFMLAAANLGASEREKGIAEFRTRQVCKELYRICNFKNSVKFSPQNLNDFIVDVLKELGSNCSTSDTLVDFIKEKKIIHKKEETSSPTQPGKTALMLAIELGYDQEVVKILLQAGADPNIDIQNLRQAKVQTDEQVAEVAELLQDHRLPQLLDENELPVGQEPKLVTGWGSEYCVEGPLAVIDQILTNIDTPRELVDALTTIASYKRVNKKLNACITSQLIVERMEVAKIDANKKDEQGYSALYIAVKEGASPFVIKTLLDACRCSSADANVVGAMLGWPYFRYEEEPFKGEFVTLLRCAIAKDFVGIAKLLIDSQRLLGFKPVSTKNDNGLFYTAVRADSLKCAQLLLDEGYSMLNETHSGRIIDAIQSKEMARLVSKDGCYDQYLANLPLQNVLANNEVKRAAAFIDYLQSQKYRFDDKDLFRIAIDNNALDSVKLLLQKGFSLAGENWGDSLLKRAKSVEMIKLLTDHNIPVRPDLWLREDPPFETENAKKVRQLINRASRKRLATLVGGTLTAAGAIVAASLALEKMTGISKKITLPLALGTGFGYAACRCLLYMRDTF
jgi:ankyrin repeat protein